MKALYRKYRPTRLTDVVGQEQVVKSLADGLKQGKINHAYVFAGPRGTGKTSIARIFAHAVNNFEYQLEDEYLDIVEIDAASNNGVDNIRELREKAIIAPTKGEYKVYIIDEAHMLTKSAANALLKLLEEPPEHVIFIMATTEIDKIPITILSRTQVYTFSLAEPEVMLGHLQKIAEAEKIDIDHSGLEVVVKRGGGSFRDSLSLLDQVATLTDEKITATVLEKALGIPGAEKIKALISNYKSGNSEAIERDFRALITSGLRAENIAGEILNEIIKHPEAETLPLLRSLPDVASPFAEAKLLLALLEDNLAVTRVKSTKETTPKEAPKETSKSTEEVTGNGERITGEPATETVQAGGVHEERAGEPAREQVTESTKKLAEESVAEPVVEPAEKSAEESTEESGDFDWQNFIAKVATASSSTIRPLEKSKYKLIGDILHLYPEDNFSEKILKSVKHSAILRQNLPAGLSLEIHATGSAPHKVKDEKIAQISAIMGDVQEIDGSVPF